MTTATPLPTGNLDGYTVELRNDWIDVPPHSFLVITNIATGASYSYGFAPITTSPDNAGQIFDNTAHNFQTTSGPIILSSDQYASLAQFIDNSIIAPPYYDLFLGQECTAWAVEALNTAGVLPGIGNPNLPPTTANYNVALDILQTLIYNPYVGAAQQSYTQISQAVIGNLTALTQYGSGVLNTLFSGASGPQTVTGSDGSSYTITPNANGASTISFYDPSGNAVSNLQYFLNSDGSSTCTINDPTGTQWTSSDFLYSKTDSLIKDIQNNADGTSQVITYNADGSSTTTRYSSANGTGTATQIDQENADGTSQITTYDTNDNPTVTTYSGPNGTGSVTEINSALPVYSSITYSYTGPAFTEGAPDIPFPTPGNITATLTFANLPVNYSGDVPGTTEAFSPTGSISVYGETASSGNSGADFSASATFQNGAIVAWNVGGFIPQQGLPANEGGFGLGMETFNYDYVDPAVVTQLDYAYDNGLYPAPMEGGGSTITSTWAVESAVIGTKLNLYPLAGQTQSLGDALTALSLNDQTAQNLIISGTGIVALSNTIENIPTVEVAGVLALQNGTLQTDPITIDAGGIISGFGTVTGDITNNGIIAANGGLLDLTDSITGTGVLEGGAGSSLEIDSTDTDNITLSGTNATLLFGAAASVVGEIIGADTGDTFGIAGNQVTLATFDSAANELLLSGADGETISLNLSGDYTQNDFTIDADGNVEILCFAKGTRILTPNGEVAVNKLAIGDMVSAYGSGQDRIKFIGKRSYGAPFITNKLDALPIRIRTNAIADGIPARDLRVSPGHALFIDGVLIPASRLINGKTITQALNLKRVDYFHIELENGHNILIAENCAAESFRNEAGFRNQFHNRDQFKTLYPDDADIEQASCYPRIESGFRLYAIQQRLAARAGIMPIPVKDKTLRGYVDIANTDGKVSGWAQFESGPEVPVPLDIWVGGTLAARVLSNAYRGDLRDAGKGSGGHGFEAAIPAGLTGAVEVRLSGSNEPALPLTEAAVEKLGEGDNVVPFPSVGAGPITELAREGASARVRLRPEAYGLRAG